MENLINPISKNMETEKLLVGMKRNIPSINNSLLGLMYIPGKIKLTEDTLEDNYETFIKNIETSIEKRLIIFLNEMGINASVKSERYSLPIKYQIKTTQYGESYLNGAFETYKLFREVAKHVSTNDIQKLRFYVFAEIEDQFPMGKVNYYFNFHY